MCKLTDIEIFEHIDLLVSQAKAYTRQSYLSTASLATFDMELYINSLANERVEEKERIAIIIDRIQSILEGRNNES
jgi:hypothetical protein